MIGGNLIFSATPYYPMTISASEASTIFRISKNTVFELCMINRTFLKAYLEDISNHSLLLGDKIKHAIKRSIRESLSAYLLQESLVQKSRTIKLRITKKALADRFGVQRTSISRELQKMKNDGLIDYDSKTITLINL
jgi:CRP-like cAMP-binding protein